MSDYTKSIAAFIGALIPLLVLAHIPMPAWLSDQGTITTIGSIGGAVFAAAVTFFAPKNTINGATAVPGPTPQPTV